MVLLLLLTLLAVANGGNPDQVHLAITNQPSEMVFIQIRSIADSKRLSPGQQRAQPRDHSANMDKFHLSTLGRPMERPG